MFDSGYRIGNISDDEATKMQFWNGCVFVDIDSAKYTGKYANQFFSVFDKFTQ